MASSKALFAIVGGLFCLVAEAAPLDLLDAWLGAANNDPAWKAAKADARYDQAEQDKALAGLLPSANLSMTRSRNELERESGTAYSLRYHSAVDSLALRQALIRLPNFADYRRAVAQGKAADHRLRSAEQQLAVRVAQAYFDTLLAADQLRITERQASSLSTQLDAARSAFRSGSGTRIEIDEAQSRLKLTEAEALANKNALEIARRRLATMTASNAAELAPLNDVGLDSLQLNPANFTDWFELALKENPDLAAALKSIDAAEWSVDRARAAHLPTLDLVASRTRYDSDSLSTINNRYQVDTLGLQLNVPIYSGGYINADTTQARAREQRALAEHEGIRQELEVRVLKEYTGVTQGRERLAALEQALEASRATLNSTRRGIEAGTRNQLDVLNAERDSLAVELALSRARYEFIINYLRLLALGNLLSGEEIVKVNALLLHKTQPSVLR
jgi:outer membrane protein/protease secretion system outer membrane protein